MRKNRGNTNLSKVGGDPWESSHSSKGTAAHGGHTLEHMKIVIRKKQQKETMMYCLKPPKLLTDSLEVTWDNHKGGVEVAGVKLSVGNVVER